MDWISCQARVATRRELSLRPTTVREKKKVAANKFAFAHNSAMVWAIADFPAPGGQEKRLPVLETLLYPGHYLLKDRCLVCG